MIRAQARNKQSIIKTQFWENAITQNLKIIFFNPPPPKLQYQDFNSFCDRVFSLLKFYIYNLYYFFSGRYTQIRYLTILIVYFLDTTPFKCFVKLFVSIVLNIVITQWLKYRACELQNNEFESACGFCLC